jgi:thiol-disulfide isomerase/thioredoxin
MAACIGAAATIAALLTAFALWSLYAWRTLDARSAAQVAAARDRTRAIFDPSRWMLTSVADGKQVRLADLRGHVLLVTQWATWCQPCVDELPRLAELARMYETESRFTVVMISGETRERVNAFLSTHPYGLSFYVVEEGMLAELGSSALPRTTLIDCVGKIVENWRGLAWAADPTITPEIDQLLASCTPA